MNRFTPLAGLLAAASLIGAAHGATVVDLSRDLGQAGARDVGVRASIAPSALAGDSVTGMYHRPVIGHTPLSPVPEPAAWAMIMVGAGFVGGALRRRRAPGTAARAD